MIPQLRTLTAALLTLYVHIDIQNRMDSLTHECSALGWFFAVSFIINT